MGDLVRSPSAMLGRMLHAWRFLTSTLRAGKAALHPGQQLAEEDSAEQFRAVREMEYGSEAGLRLALRADATAAACALQQTRDLSGATASDVEGSAAVPWMLAVEHRIQNQERQRREGSAASSHAQSSPSPPPPPPSAPSVPSVASSPLPDGAAVTSEAIGEGGSEGGSKGLVAIVSRLDLQLGTLARETKAAESAIAQALKLLQAQVMSKAARAELQHGLASAMDTAHDAQERSRAVATSLVSIATDIDKRAPLEALARLEQTLQSNLAGSATIGGPMIHARRIDHRDSPLQPTHCLSCKQPLPYRPQSPPPHQLATAPGGGRVACSSPPRSQAVMGHDGTEASARHGMQQQQQPMQPMQPMHMHPAGAGGSATASSLSVEPAGGAAGFVALAGHGFHTMGSLRRDGLDLSRNAKLTYGVPPANDQRKRMQLQLQLLSASPSSPSMRGSGGFGGGGSRGTRGGAVRVASAKGERASRPIEAVVGHSRPMSAAALLPGQSRPIRVSASAGALI